jgi:hypothetical protein
MSEKQLYATIFLPYFKQGDDMLHGLVTNDDETVNVKQSIVNHIELLKCAIEHLEKINNLIPEENDCSIHAGIHHIGISGNERVLKLLADEELVRIESEESSDSDSGYSGESSTELEDEVTN